MRRLYGILVFAIILLLIAGCATRAPTAEEKRVEEAEEAGGGQIKLEVLNNTNTTENETEMPVPEEKETMDEKTEEDGENESIKTNETVDIKMGGEETTYNESYESLVEELNFESGKNDLTVYFIDAGEGDASLIQTPAGKNVMVDCGTEESARKVRLFLERKGIEDIDVLILSNGHNDYIGGCARLVEGFEIDKIYYNGIDVNSEPFEEFMYNVRYYDLDLEPVREDKSLGIDGEVNMKMLIPYGKSYITNTRDNSVLLRVAYSDSSFLLTGACGVGCEKRLLEKEKLLEADVLKLGRHGSIEASSTLFLDKVMPYIAVITGEGSRMRNMPTFDLLTNLEKRGIEVYRTDYDGTITVSTAGKYYDIDVEWGAEYFDWESPTNISYVSYNKCTYVSHVTSNVFMPIECPVADDIAPQNRMCYTTREQAIEQGLKEYRHCDAYWWEE